jgi:hypothetical protein
VQHEPKRNITLSLPVSLLKQIKVVAAQRETSVSALIAEQLQKLVPPSEESVKSMADLIASAPNSGFGEKVPWTREEIYDRHER